LYHSLLVANFVRPHGLRLPPSELADESIPPQPHQQQESLQAGYAAFEPSMALQYSSSALPGGYAAAGSGMQHHGAEAIEGPAASVDKYGDQAASMGKVREIRLSLAGVHAWLEGDAAGQP
jgi:hypothetical protein